MIEAGPSHETSSEMDVCDEQSKGELTNALKYAECLLRNWNLLTDTPPSMISGTSLAMGEEIANEILHMLADRQVVHVEELIGVDEIDEHHEYTSVSIVFISVTLTHLFWFFKLQVAIPQSFTLQCKGVQEDDDECVAEEFTPVPKDYIPLWYKERAVALAAAHPKWSLKSLQANGCSRLKHKKHLYRWRDDVKRGGTNVDKWTTIDQETYERFLEARQNLEQVIYCIAEVFRRQIIVTIPTITTQGLYESHMQLITIYSFLGDDEDSATVGDDCCDPVCFG